MRNYFSSRKGFTLIELLIVIALLGALAVGLIGAIDPFEQLKKGADTGTRDLVNQVQTAVIRYYSVKNAMPFAADITTPITLDDAGFAAALTNIKGAGELRSDFETIQGAKLKLVYISGTVDPPTASVCYTPTSKSFQSDPNTKYDPAHTGKLATDVSIVCKSANAATGVDCDWCIQ